MTNYQPGDLVLVPFPFTDLTTTKRRPAMVLAFIVPKKLPPLLVVAMITSQINAETMQGDLLIKHWEEANLLYPSKIRLAKLVSIEKNLVVNQLGSLQKKDLEGVKKEFKKLFSAFI